MKKLFLLFLVLFLFSCEKTKIIEVNHTNNGYTTEVFGTLKLNNENDYISGIESYDNKFFISIYNRYDTTHKKYEFNYEDKSFHFIESIQDNNLVVDRNDNIYESTLFENDNFQIKSVTEWNKNITSYYYIKDNESKLLIEENLNNNHELQIFTNVYYDNNGIYLVLNEIEGIAIYKLEDDQLIKVNEYKTIDNNFKLTQFHRNKGINTFVYESDQQIKIVKNENEYLYDLYLDDYKLKDYDINKNKFIYEKNGYIKLIINNEIYDFGYNPEYHITEKYILNTTWREDYKGKENHVYDLNTKEKYIFSEYLEIDEYSFYYNDDYYLVYNPLQDEQYYSIMHIEDKEVTVMDLPFSKDVKSSTCFDRSILFYEKNADEIIFYLVKF